MESKRGRIEVNEARKAAMYLIQRLGDYRLNEIAHYFGLQHYGSAAAVIYTLKRVLGDSQKLRRKLNNVIKRFDPY